MLPGTKSSSVASYFEGVLFAEHASNSFVISFTYLEWTFFFNFLFAINSFFIENI